MVKLAVEAMLGKKLKDSKYGTGLLPQTKLYAVKVPVFSGEKFADVDTYLGPEMKSTGEVLGVDLELDVAIYKGFVASNTDIPLKGGLYISLKDVDKEEAVEIIKKYEVLGFQIYTSKGTGEYLENKGIKNEIIDSESTLKLICEKEINIVINTPTIGNDLTSKAFKIRRKAAEYRVPVFTCIDTAKVFLTAIEVKKSGRKINYRTINYYRE